MMYSPGLHPATATTAASWDRDAGHGGDGELGWGVGDLGMSGAPQVCGAALDAARERGRRGNRYHY